MEKEFLINAGELSAAIKRLKPFMSKEETRYYLNGIYFELLEGSDDINLVATDGHKLGVLTEHVDRLEGFDGEIKAIIPAKGLDTMLAMLKGVKEDWPITLRFSDDGRLVLIDTPDEKGEFKLIDGTYPDYRKVIPSDPANFTIGLAKAQAKEAMKALAGHKEKEGMRWELTDDGSPLTLRSEKETVVVMPMRISLPGERLEEKPRKKDPNQSDLEDHLGDAA